MRRLLSGLAAAAFLLGCEMPAECSDDEPMHCEGGDLIRCVDGQREVAMYCEGAPCQAPCTRTICIFFSCGEVHGGGCCGDRMTW